VAYLHDTTETLQKLGYRLTPQRLMILEAVGRAEGHTSAEEIYEQVHIRYPYMNISTVYRTLDLLEALGQVTKTDMGDGRVRYHGMGKGHHHHLVCQKCGAIIDVDEEFLSSLWKEIMRQYGFKVEMNHLAFFGLCRDCSR